MKSVFLGFQQNRMHNPFSNSNIIKLPPTMNLKSIFDKVINIQVYEENDEKQIDVLQSCIILMRWFRMWPQPGQKFTWKDMILLSFIMAPVTSLNCAIDIVYTYATKKNYMLDDILTDFVVMGAATNMYCTLFTFMSKIDNIQKLAHNLGNFTTFAKPSTFSRANNFANFVTIFLTAYTIGGVIIYAVFGILHREACIRENEELAMDRICGLFAPARLPANFKEFPYYHIFLFLQIYNCTVVCVGAVLILTFIYGCIEVLASRIDLFKDQLSKTFKINDKQKRIKHLKYCVKYHVYLTDLTQQLNDSLSTVSFMQAFFTSGVIAVIAFQFLMTPQLRTLIHGAGWVAVLFMLAYAGQRLIDETADIPMVIYSTDWFIGDVESQKYVLMIIWRGNKSLYLDAQGFGSISFTTFAAALQNSYSVLALLHQDKD